jgi:purine-binding chemotaxis protein CheW
MRKLLIFSLGKYFYAFDILNVIEIIKTQNINKIPNTDKRILGVTDIRGRISTVLDLRAILQMDVKEEANYFVIVPGLDDRQFIFPVTDVLNIEEFTDDKIKASGNDALISSKYVEKFFEYKDNIVTILNTENLINFYLMVEKEGKDGVAE